MLQVPTGPEDPRRVLGLLISAPLVPKGPSVPTVRRTLLAFAVVGALPLLLTSAGPLAELLGAEPLYARRAMGSFAIAALLLGLMVRRWLALPTLRARTRAALAVGALVHPIGFCLYVVTARLAPTGSDEVVGDLLTDLSSALHFSVASIAYGGWFTTLLAALAVTLTVWPGSRKPNAQLGS